MKIVTTILMAGGLALANVALAQTNSDQSKAPHNAATDQGTTKPAQANPKGKGTATTGMKAEDRKLNSSGNAEINQANPQGSRPGENTRKPGDMDKSR